LSKLIFALGLGFIGDRDCNMSRSVWALADEEVTEHLQCSEEESAREWIAMLIATLKHDDQTRVL
jgi:hypothetical protein